MWLPNYRKLYFSFSWTDVATLNEFGLSIVFSSFNLGRVLSFRGSAIFVQGHRANNIRSSMAIRKWFVPTSGALLTAATVEEHGRVVKASSVRFESLEGAGVSHRSITRTVGFNYNFRTRNTHDKSKRRIYMRTDSAAVRHGLTVVRVIRRCCVMSPSCRNKLEMHCSYIHIKFD